MDEIERLALAEHSARIAVERMAMANTWGKTVEELRAQSVSYAKAQREYWLAKQALKAAIEAPPTPDGEG
jgi:hypothetical protein